MQIEEPLTSVVQQPPAQDVLIPAAIVTEPWQAPPRRDDDDDALLNAAIISATQERSVLANTVAHQVEQPQQEVHRVGLVCPRYPRRHDTVARAVLDATDTRCLRCNTYPRLAKHGRAVLHATSSFVDGAYPTTWAVPEGQVHILQLTIDLHGCLW